jgi:hypothetical protein
MIFESSWIGPIGEERKISIVVSSCPDSQTVTERRPQRLRGVRDPSSKGLDATLFGQRNLFGLDIATEDCLVVGSRDAISICYPRHMPDPTPDLTLPGSTVAELRVRVEVLNKVLTEIGGDARGSAAAG